MTFAAMLRRPSAVVPILMSGTTLSIAPVLAVLQGTAPQQDEGAAVHIWQLPLAVQFPIVFQ